MTFFNKNKNTEMVTTMKESKDSLGSRIAENRKEKGFTQEGFAEIMGVTAQAVSKWENDVSCPDIMLIPKIADVFGISTDELLGKEEPKIQSGKAGTYNNTNAVNSKNKLRISITDARNNKTKPVNIVIPVAFALKIIGAGLEISTFFGNDALNNVPIGGILEVIKSGVTGEILDLTTDDGTKINIEIS